MKTVIGIILVFVLVGSVVGVETVSLKDEGQTRLRPSTSGGGEATREVLVFLAPGTNVQAFAQEHGLTFRHALQSDSEACVFEASSVDAASSFVADADSNAQVRSAYLNTRLRVTRTAFSPNDPYFPKDTPVASWPGQWHLVNGHTAGLDAGVQGAWNSDITGSGVIIGIVDDGVETTHEDLAANYVSADSYDFGQHDGNPDPVHSSDVHGTSVAGVAAARGGNGIGVTGAAPHAGIAGLRVDFENATVAQFVDATLYHSSGANTHIRVKNHSYGISLVYVSAQARVDALETSADCGTIHTRSAGNSREDGWDTETGLAYARDANKRHQNSTPAVITVAALGSDGTFANYSNYGANVFVTAPSSTEGGFRITTTDLTGTAGRNPTADTLLYGTPFPNDNYTAHFGGTSSAAPLVAGVMALGVEAQPALDTRFAKHLLVKSSNKVDEDDATEESGGGWVTNAAGNSFNQNYGFGLVDAAEFVEMATQYTGVTALITETTGTVNVGAELPDAEEDTVTRVDRTCTVSATTPLEEVLLTLDIEHTYRGDLEAYLISPENGTECRMMMNNGFDDGEDLEWTFLTNAFWGENPVGEWTVGVQDCFEGDTGTWNSFAVTLRMGELVPIPEPATLALLGGGLVLLRRLRRRRFHT